MKKYLVGGAVRNQLLGCPVTERDWVVVGETTETMKAKGFRPVGKDFPVFLHPETHEEYALARTERKTAPGYRGFDIHVNNEITLEQDLLRRDLTINAMARDANGNLIDLYNGKKDLEKRLLRHVSPAFREDPVRILRVARFSARFSHLGFRVAEETMELMKSMVDSGEVDALVSERVWAEFVRALTEKTPTEFIKILYDCGALANLFPEIERLFGVPQPATYHPEIDTGIHTLMVLEQSTLLSDDPLVRFAALMHDLGKGLTPKQYWPSHRGHEKLGLTALKQICKRLKLPKEFKSLAEKVMQYHTHCHRVFSLRPSTLVDTLQLLDAFRQRNKFELFLLACEADARGRKGLEHKPYPQADFFRAVNNAALSIDVDSVVKKELRGAEIGKELRQLRINAVAECKRLLIID